PWAGRLWGRGGRSRRRRRERPRQRRELSTAILSCSWRHASEEWVGQFGQDDVVCMLPNDVAPGKRNLRCDCGIIQCEMKNRATGKDASPRENTSRGLTGHSFVGPAQFLTLRFSVMSICPLSLNSLGGVLSSAARMHSRRVSP